MGEGIGMILTVKKKKFHEEGVLTGLSRLQLSRKLEIQE